MTGVTVVSSFFVLSISPPTFSVCSCRLCNVMWAQEGRRKMTNQGVSIYIEGFLL